jgi:hypothetical protein
MATLSSKVTSRRRARLGEEEIEVERLDPTGVDDGGPDGALAFEAVGNGEGFLDPGAERPEDNAAALAHDLGLADGQRLGVILGADTGAGAARVAQKTGPGCWSAVWRRSASSSSFFGCAMAAWGTLRR